MADVLIVGAGPTGLALAADLAQNGVSARLIDKASAPSDKSKALGVQAGTLETLERVFGRRLPDEMVKTGQPAREAFVHVDDRPPLRVDLGAIPSPYDFILILPQSETERLLEERLRSVGGAVERRRELVSLREDASGVAAVLRGPGQPDEEVSFRFVVGCDGAHSTTREAAGIPFEGGAYVGDFILGDVVLRWPWPSGTIRTFVNSEGLMPCFPFRGERRYRLIVVLRGADPASGDVSLEELRAHARRLSRGAVEVESASWLSRFRVHHRLASRFRKGRVLLAGDAAHIHSPAGGQGMNTGVQDALNLSDKLTRVLRGEPSSLLDAYEDERMPVARAVLRGTDLAFKLALAPESTAVRLVRRAVLPRLLRRPWLQRRALRAISEVDVAHRELARRDRREISKIPRS